MSTGHRERKRERTRAALLETSTRLFVERGFDEVSVAEIAEAVGVATRTVYRYFDSKESLVMGHIDQTLEMFREGIREAPAGAPLLSSLRDIVLDIVGSFEDVGELDRLRVELIASHPGLARRHMERLNALEAELVPLVAQRMGVADPTDMRPALVLGCAAVAARVALAAWLAGGADVPVSDVLDEAFGHLSDGLATLTW